MKPLITIFLLSLSLLSFGQSMEHAADSIAKADIVQYATDSLESSIKRDAWWNQPGPLWIDSLVIPVNTSYTFEIQMKIENQTTLETGGETIKMDIGNRNGIYTIDYSYITYPFHLMKSLAGCTFSIILPKQGAPYMQGVGISAPIYWSTKRTFFKLSL